MSYLIWRLHRTQVYFAAAALGVMTVVLLITGLTMAHDYRTFFAHCAATQSCSDSGQLFSGDGAIIDAVNLTLVVPLLFGLFWGAPLLAKEYEDGTHNLAWTQGVTRRQWVLHNVMWALLAAVVWGGALTILVSWWRSPENALDSRFGAFDIQGIVPVAYALFAVALGIAVGSLIRRVLPALALTLGTFVILRVVVGFSLRPHFLTPIAKAAPLGGAGAAPPGAWVLSSTLVGPRRQPLPGGLTPDKIPAACQNLLGRGKEGLLPCLTSHGFQQLVTYQPANRFWMFQGIESAGFVVLATALLVLAYRRVLWRDA